MPRIALLADIHGNMPAFEAVLKDIAAQQIDQVYLVGDLVGRGPQGSAVTRRVRELGLQSVRGNHEDYLLDFRKKTVPAEWFEAEEWACARWMSEELSDDDEKFLDALPLTMTVQGDVRIVHGSSRSYNEGIGPWLGADEIQSHFDQVEEPVLICGHTHRAAVWHVDGGLLVNVGSVGMPFNGDRRAQYAVLERQEQAWDVELRQVPYDLEQFITIYHSTGFLENGGATAELLLMELQHATPFLVPFLKWCDVSGHVPLARYVPSFLEFHRPDLPLAIQFERFNTLKASISTGN